MAKTAYEVVALAHRRLGVLSADEALQADQYEFGVSVLEGVIAELEAVQGLALTWDETNVPDGLFLPVAYLVAADLAAHYEIAPRDTRGRLILQIRAYELPDDREDRRDTDEDGAVSDEEVAADGRAAFY